MWSYALFSLALAGSVAADSDSPKVTLSSAGYGTPCFYAIAREGGRPVPLFTGIKQDNLQVCSQLEQKRPNVALKGLSTGVPFSCGILAADDTVACVSAYASGISSYNVKVKSVSTGMELACAVLAADDLLMCWGNYLQYAEAQPTLMANVPADLSVESVSVGYYCGCAVKLQDSTLRCWGYTQFVNAMPAELQGEPVSVVSVGFFTACAVLKRTKKLVCWGGNMDYQKSKKIDLPPALENVRVSSVSVGLFTFCAVKESTMGVACYCPTEKCSGEVTWHGKAIEIRGGSGEDSGVPSAMEGGCAVRPSGAVECWYGNGVSYELGAGAVQNFDARRVLGLASSPSRTTIAMVMLAVVTAGSLTAVVHRCRAPLPETYTEEELMPLQ